MTNDRLIPIPVPRSYVITEVTNLKTGRTAQINIAASNASAIEKQQADLTCGGINDKASIQTKIAANVKIHLSSGTFNLEDVLIGENGLEIEMEKNTILYVKNATPKNAIEFVSKHDFYIHGGIIDGNYLNQADGGTDRYQNGIYLETCYDFAVKNVDIKNCYYSGFECNSCYRGQVKLAVHNNKDNGALFTRGAGVGQFCYQLNIDVIAYLNGTSGAAIPSGGAYSGVVLINLNQSHVKVIAWGNGAATTIGWGVYLGVESNADFANNICHFICNNNYESNVVFVGSDNKLFRQNQFFINASAPQHNDNVNVNCAAASVTQNTFEIIENSAGRIGVYIQTSCTGNFFKIISSYQNSGNPCVYLQHAAVTDNSFHDCFFNPTSAPYAFFEDIGDYNFLYNSKIVGTITVAPVQFKGVHSKAWYVHGLYSVESAGQWNNTILAGYYFTGISERAATTLALVASTLYAIPYWVNRDIRITKLAIHVNTAAAAGKIVRIGLYRDNGACYPGTLVIDAGTVTVDAVGVRAIDFSGTPKDLKSGLYWMVVVSDSTPTLKANTCGWSPLGMPATDFTIDNAMYSKAAVGSGALADPCVAAMGVVANSTQVIIAAFVAGLM